MLFNTKGKTLLKLRSNGFNVPKLILIKEKNFLKNSDKIIEQISTEFKGFVAIRSSAINEDSSKESLAGKYLSFLNINPKNKILVKNKINKVIESYDGNENNEIIIQDMVENSVMSGVCTTADLHNYLPIININYDKNNRTDTVTSGSNNSYTLTLFEITKKIDSGKILYKKYFSIPKKLISIEKDFDNKIRALTLIEFLQTKTNYRYPLTKKSYLPYYIAHPLIRQIVLNKNYF